MKDNATLGRVAVVRGMWGDWSLARRRLQPPRAFEEVRSRIQESINREHFVADEIFVYGKENKAWLDTLSVKSTLMDERPWASPHKEGVGMSFRFRWAGAIRNGYSYWWHKFKIIEKALMTHSDGVLWIDFDVLQLKGFDEVRHILDDLALGKPVRASLYCQHNWTWGAGWRHDAGWEIKDTHVATGDHHQAARIIMGCGFLFIRDLKIVQEMIALQDVYTHFLDHQIVSLWFDLQHEGRWIGEQRYLKEGWHTKHYYYGRQIYPPALSDIVFQAGDLQKKVVLE